MELITNMELCFALTVIACISLLFKALLHSLSSFKSNSKCPPGPKGIPVISTVKWVLKSTLEIETTVKLLCSKYGKIITLRIGSHLVIFISSRSLAHQALVQNGTVFADRPKPLLTAKILSSNQFNISSASCGPTWRLLRRNLTAQILHPSKTKDFSFARKWALDMLLKKLRVSAVRNVGVVRVQEHFCFAIFSLLMFMCFGVEDNNLHESKIREIEVMQHRLVASFNRFFILDFCWVSVTKILFSNRWNELFELRKKREELLLPLIRAQKTQKHVRTSYVDALLTVELPENENSTTAAKRKLTEEELVNLCSEFLNAGTDTTSTALQWIMANLVKYPRIQAKIFDEIKGVIKKESVEIGEDELSKMPYLKAVVLEGLRRHPPGDFVVPHAVTQEVGLGGYTIPKNAIINFMVAQMGWDPEVWENPMEFKPEKFLLIQGTEEFDITGSREIKMMPFGAGRRMCPAFGLALLHLEYFVANLVWNFEWTAEDGDEVNLSEKQEFTIVMKYPLLAHNSARQN